MKDRKIPQPEPQLEDTEGFHCEGWILTRISTGWSLEYQQEPGYHTWNFSVNAASPEGCLRELRRRLAAFYVTSVSTNGRDWKRIEGREGYHCDGWVLSSEPSGWSLKYFQEPGANTWNFCIMMASPENCLRELRRELASFGRTIDELFGKEA